MKHTALLKSRVVDVIAFLDPPQKNMFDGAAES